MKAGAVLSLIVAIVLSIVAINGYIEDSEKRREAVNGMRTLATVNWSHAAFESYNEKADKAEAAEHVDGIISLVAIVFLICLVGPLHHPRFVRQPSTYP
ncbi:MAG TPA: hypothetical protein VFO39_16165 [Candidatus Sulfotelmatobacter sp.]|nr:hypothetical protein [Candidatus Sulfotelmatobacter sp.]